MRKYLILLVFITAVSCEPNPEVKPGYIVGDIRPLGMKAEPVEAVPGDMITLSMLIGGRTFSQGSDLKISWLGLEELTIPYTKPLIFPVPENLEELMPADSDNPQASLFIDNFNKNGFADLPVTASFEIPVQGGPETRTLTVTKTVRIYKEPPEDGIRKNPVINHVLASYEIYGSVKSFEIEDGGFISFSISQVPETIIFRSIPLSQEETGWDRLNFAWFFTSDTGELLENDMEVELDRKKYGDAVPEDQKATQNREYFALSFKPVLEEIEESKIKLPVKFNFYHIIRDKAIDAQSSADYRWGQDFMWFEIEITEDE